jgi:cystathionine beta-lyase/cystathionine gamma-synthase
MKDETRANHPPAVRLDPDNRAVVDPIYQSVKFAFASVEETLRHNRGERAGFSYSRIANPTVRQLELLLAQLQGREECLVTSSGVNVIAQTLLALTKAGDHVVCCIETYGPTRRILRRLLGRFGVSHTLHSVEDPEGIERTLAATPTRLLVFESPTNPVTKIADIPAFTALARRHGALSVLDNTFAGFHQHGEYDIDVYLHSLTKYASGAGDVMGGAVIASSRIIAGIRPDFDLFGAALDPHAAFLMLRGLKTYFLRYREQSRRALEIARMLAAHGAVERVHYPGLPTHPQAALARAQMRDFGAVVSFDLKGGAEAGRRFADALTLFALTSSIGSTESLVLAPQMIGTAGLSPAEAARSGIGAGTVRLSIGLEDTADLIADLEQALARA